MEGDGADSEQYLRMRLAVSYTDSLSFPTDLTVIIATKNDIVKHDASLTVHTQAFKAFGDGLDASKIKQNVIAIPGIEKPSVEDALGSLNEKKANKELTAINLEPATNYEGVFECWKDDTEVCHLRGSVSKTGTVTTSDLITVLPVGFRPLSNRAATARMRPSSGNEHAFGRVNINENGTINVYFANISIVPTQIGFDAVFRTI